MVMSERFVECAISILMDINKTTTEAPVAEDAAILIDGLQEISGAGEAAKLTIERQLFRRLRIMRQTFRYESYWLESKEDQLRRYLHLNGSQWRQFQAVADQLEKLFVALESLEAEIDKGNLAEGLTWGVGSVFDRAMEK